MFGGRISTMHTLRETNWKSWSFMLPRSLEGSFIGYLGSSDEFNRRAMDDILELQRKV